MMLLLLLILVHQVLIVDRIKRGPCCNCALEGQVLFVCKDGFIWALVQADIKSDAQHERNTWASVTWIC
jgi:hypothetical protein